LLDNEEDNTNKKCPRSFFLTLGNLVVPVDQVKVLANIEDRLNLLENPFISNIMLATVFEMQESNLQ